MATSPIRNTPPTQSWLTQLPEELKTQIVKRVHDSVVEETAIRNPNLSREEAAREAARSWARLNVVNRDLHDVTKKAMNEFPDVGLSITRIAIHGMDGDDQFQQSFRRLIQNNKYVEVPLSSLSPNNQEIVLDELSRGQVAHLEKIKLDMSEELGMDLPPPGLCQRLIQTIEAMIQGNQRLEVGLDLSRAHIENQDATGTDMAKTIANRLLHRLTDLNLANNVIGIDGVMAIAEKLSQSKLTELNLSATGITEQGVIAIAAAIAEKPRQSGLRKLVLSHNQIGNEGAKAIAANLPKTELASLDLTNTQLEPEGIDAISGALWQSTLRNLELRRNEMDAQNIILIANALQDSELISLNLSDTGITAQDAEAIAEKLQQSKLTKLDLSMNQIEDEGAKAIARKLKKSKLSDLNLSENGIGDEGAITIAKALRHSKLISMDLSMNQIGDAGINAIANAQPSSKLIQLDLENQIEDEDADDIEDEGALST